MFQNLGYRVSSGRRIDTDVNVSKMGGMSIPLSQARARRSRQAAPQPRREQLLEIAKTCCAESGFEALTVESITSRAGVSRATFYQYFSSTEEIFLTLVETAAHDLSEAQKFSEEDFDTPRAVIRHTTTAYARAVFATGGLVAVIDRRSEVDPAVAVVWQSARSRTRERYTRYIQQLHDAGRISPCTDPARIVGTLSDALTSGAPRVGKRQRDQNRFIEEHLAITERLLGLDR